MGEVLPGEKGNMSHSLRTLKTQGWMVIGRPSGGKAAYVEQTSAGLLKGAEIFMKL
jgi:hypothetical protein